MQVGDALNLAYPNSKFRRGRIGHGYAQTITTGGGGQAVLVAYDEQNQNVHMDGTVGCLTTDGSSPKHNNRVIEMLTDTNHVRIRKLTPLECWRLMGFDDEDFYKAAKVNSDSQLYKQAGNSIVVQVLESVIGEML